MGSLSVLDGRSTDEVDFSAEMGFEVALRALRLVSGELSLLIKTFLGAVFFAVFAACVVVVVDLDTARVVRVGAGGSAGAFVREEARVVLALLAMQGRSCEMLWRTEAGWLDGKHQTRSMRWRGQLERKGSMQE